MKKHNKLFLAEADQRQRFSIRKLTIGAASVLLGTCFFLSGQNSVVKADTTPTIEASNSSTSDIDQQNEQKTKDAIDKVKEDLNGNGEVDEDNAKTIDRTIHYKEKGTGTTLANDKEQDISLVPYYKNGNVTITYHDDTDDKDLDGSDTITHYVGTKIKDDEVNNKIDSKTSDFKNNGYELSYTDVNGLDPSHKFTEKDQHIIVHLKHGTETVTKTKTGTQTLHYEGAGDQTPSDVTNTVTFTRDKTTDKVTNDITYGDWDTNSQTYPVIDTPAIPGYTASISQVGGDTVTATDEDLNRKYTVIYTKNKQSAKVIYRDLDNNNSEIADSGDLSGETSDTIDYDPSKEITALENKGYQLVTNGFELGSKFDNDDANDQIFYIDLKHKIVKQTQEKTVTRKISYVDGSGNTVADQHQDSFKFEGSGNLDKVTGKYVNLNDDGSIKDQNGEFTWNADSHDFDKVVSPSIDKMHVVSVTPNDQADGNDVKKVTVDHNSNDINVTVTYADNGTTVKNKQNIPATQTVHFVDNTGKTLRPDNTQNFEFDYSGDTCDATTDDKLSDGSWNAQSHKFDNVTVPVITGYVANTNQAGQLTATHDDPNVEQTIIYTPVGKIVPVDKSGNPIPDAPTPKYENDPNDPTKVKNKESVPTIDGYYTDTKSITPTDPIKDTDVTYLKYQNAKVEYVDQDENNQVITSSNTLTGKSGDDINYSTESTILDLENKGYELVSDAFTNTNAKYDSDDSTTQTYQVVLKHKTTTITPTNPGKPGEAINPKDPNGVKWPEGTDKDSLIKTGTQTVHYEDADDQTPKDNVTTIEFDHSITYDNVTGKVVKDNGWSPAEQTYQTIITPEIDGYEADKSEAGGDSVKATDANLNREYTVTYKKTPVTVTGTVTYIDDDAHGNKILTIKKISGTVGSAINYSTSDLIKFYEDRGLVFYSDSFTKSDKKFKSEGNNFEVHFKHTFVPVNPNTGKIIGPSNPSSPAFPSTPAFPAMLFANFIQVRSSDEEDQPTVYYAIVDTKKNKIIAKDLSENEAKAELAEVISPNIPGYHLVDENQKIIEKLFVNKDSNKHTDITVLYEKDAEDPKTDPTPQPDPDPVDPVVPSNPTSPTEPTNPTSPTKPVQPTKPAAPTPKPDKPKKNKPKKNPTPNKPTLKTPHHDPKQNSWNENFGVHGQDVTGNNGSNSRWNNNFMPHGQSGYYDENGQYHAYTSNGEIVNTDNNSPQASANELPQTGAKQNKLGLIGLAFASVAALLGLGVDRKKD